MDDPRPVRTRGGALSQSPPPHPRPLAAVRDWLRAHDPNYGALRRAARTALIMPAMFALGDKVIGNPILATFAAFGSIALLLLVDFTGPLRDRLSNQAAVAVASGGLICLGTLASQRTWLAALAMAVVAFLILFAGVLSSALAGASTTLLLAFILPVSLRGDASSIPARVEGWEMAAGASLLAIAFLWPAPARNPVRGGAIAAGRALAERLRAEIAYMTGAGDAAADRVRREATARADEAVQTMQRLFLATPYRPTGLSTDGRAVARVVDELRWLNGIVLRAAPRDHPPSPDRHVCSVKGAAADVLQDAADLLETPNRSPADLRRNVAHLSERLDELESSSVEALPGTTSNSGEESDMSRRVISSLDPRFRAQELGFVAAQIAASADFAAAATRRSWLDRLLGRQPRDFPGPLAAARERIASHLERHSSWLHNSIRGAAALGLAVLIADLSSVQHGFWVVFGTLSVLRSNALNTGENLVRALLGTALGFLVGGLLVYLIGTNTTLLWILLPVAVLLAGLAPAAISFTAGQAAFTLTLLILFNLLAPSGWKIGLVRVEDVALGGVVSVLIGLLFWPRGAASAFGRALAVAYTAGSRYLAAAVAYGVGRCDSSGPPAPAPREEAMEASAAATRLDDTFRNYLTERGAKSAPLAEVAELVTGVTGVTLAGDAVLALWDGDRAQTGDRSRAREALLSASGQMTGWYAQLASSVTGEASVPDPLPHDEIAAGHLVEAVRDDLQDVDGHGTATGVRVLWTGDQLDALRRSQPDLVGSARATFPSTGRVPMDMILGHRRSHTAEPKPEPAAD